MTPDWATQPDWGLASSASISTGNALFVANDVMGQQRTYVAQDYGVCSCGGFGTCHWDDLTPDPGSMWYSCVSST
jgi:hypothetical protein